MSPNPSAERADVGSPDEGAGGAEEAMNVNGACGEQRPERKREELPLLEEDRKSGLCINSLGDNSKKCLSERKENVLYLFSLFLWKRRRRAA